MAGDHNATTSAARARRQESDAMVFTCGSLRWVSAAPSQHIMARLARHDLASGAATGKSNNKNHKRVSDRGSSAVRDVLLQSQHRAHELKALREGNARAQHQLLSVFMRQC